MLRILVKSLLASTFLVWPAAASSILELPAMNLEMGRSMMVVAEAGPGIDPVTTAAYEQEPQVIRAPDFVEISPSIIMMVPGAERAGGSISALGEPAIEEAPTPVRQARRELSPMVIRGGLVGEAFSSTGTQAPDVLEEQREERSADRQRSQPETRRAPAGDSETRRQGNGGSAERRPAAQSPAPRDRTPAAPPTGVPM